MRKPTRITDPTDHSRIAVDRMAHPRGGCTAGYYVYLDDDRIGHVLVVDGIYMATSVRAMAHHVNCGDLREAVTSLLAAY